MLSMKEPTLVAEDRQTLLYHVSRKLCSAFGIEKAPHSVHLQNYVGFTKGKGAATKGCSRKSMSEGLSD